MNCPCRPSACMQVCIVQFGCAIHSVLNSRCLQFGLDFFWRTRGINCWSVWETEKAWHELCLNPKPVKTTSRGASIFPSLTLSLQPWSKVQNPVCFVFTKERTFETLWIRECCQPTLTERGGRTAHSSQRYVSEWVSMQQYAFIHLVVRTGKMS